MSWQSHPKGHLNFKKQIHRGSGPSGFAKKAQFLGKQPLGQADVFYKDGDRGDRASFRSF